MKIYGHHQNIYGTFTISKSFMRTFLVHISKFTNSFNWLTISNKIRNRLKSRIKNDWITCNTGADKFSSIKYFDELANIAGVKHNTFKYIIGTDRFTYNWWFTSWQTLLTLQTIRSVALLEQTVLLTFNGSTSWLTLLVLQTLRLVALLEKTRLLRFNILMS